MSAGAADLVAAIAAGVAVVLVLGLDTWARRRRRHEHEPERVSARTLERLRNDEVAQ